MDKEILCNKFLLKVLGLYIIPAWLNWLKNQNIALGGVKTPPKGRLFLTCLLIQF